MSSPDWYQALSDTEPQERAATSPIAFHSTTARFFGTGAGDQPSHETLLRESKGIPALGSRAIAQRVAQLNPLVKVSRRIMGGTQVDEILDDHPLKQLLDRPHPNITRSQLMRLTSQYAVDTGEAYWLKVGSRLGIPVELHPIPPQKVTPVLVRGVTEAYRVRDGNGTEQTLPADVIIRFYFPDPEDPWASEGYLGPAAVTADSLKFSGQHLRHHYQNDATPKTVLKALEGAVPFQNEAERDRFYAAWNKAYHQRFGENSGGPGITPTGYDLVQLAIQSGAEVQPLLEYWQDEMLMNYGVPKSILGKVVSGDRSSAETNAFVFDLHAVTPLADLIQDALTLQLAPDFDPSIFVEFEEFVAPDKVFELQKKNDDITHKRASPNMQLEQDGQDPVPWGERPPAKFGDVWYEPDVEPEPLPFDDPEALEDSEDAPDSNEGGGTGADDDEDRASRGRSAYFGKRAAWERQLAQEKKFVPHLARVFRGIFAEQTQEVLNALPEVITDRSRGIADVVNRIFNGDAWRRLFRFRVEPIREEAYRESLQLTLTGFGQTDEFVFADEQRKILDQQGAALVEHVNETTRIRLARTLAEGVERGESIDQLATRVRGVMQGKAGRARSRTIARTEVLKTAQAAQVDGFRQSGVVARKRWNTSLDASVRDTHEATEGQTKPIDQPFVLGNGEEADAPGVGRNGGPLSAGNAINCRCFVTPVVG